MSGPYSMSPIGSTSRQDRPGGFLRGLYGKRSSKSYDKMEELQPVLNGLITGSFSAASSSSSQASSSSAGADSSKIIMPFYTSHGYHATEACQTENTKEIFKQGCEDQIDHITETLEVPNEKYFIDAFCASESDDTLKLLNDDLETAKERGKEDLIKSLESTIKRYKKEELPEYKKFKESEKLKLQAKKRTLLAWKVAADKADSPWWVTSASYRGLIEEHETIAEVAKNYAPRSVNRRTQQVINKQGEVVSSVGRCGATTDFSDGRTSLKQMKELRKNIHGIQTFSRLSSEYVAQLKVIFRNNPKGMKLLNSHSSNMEDIKQVLSEMIDKRQLNLEHQVLQDLTAHLESMPDENLQKIVKGERPPLFVRLSLLDFVKKPGSIIDKFKGKKNTRDAEWNPHEKHQIEDMQEIFDFIHGKDIIFGNKGPFIEGDKIYIRLNRVDVEGLENCKPRKLQAAIFNVSVTKNVRNIPLQRELNSKAIEVLKKYYNELKDTLDPREKRFTKYELDRMEGLLNGAEKLNFDNAANLGNLLVTLKSMLTVNCLSGKDRTGLVLAMLTLKQLEVLYDSEHKPTNTDGASSSSAAVSDPERDMEIKNRQLADWGEQLLTEDSIIMQVIRQNTNFKGVPLKLVPKDFCSTLLGRSDIKDKLAISTRVIGAVAGAFVGR